MKAEQGRYHLTHYGNSLTELMNAYGYSIKLGQSAEDSILMNEAIYLCPLCLHNYFYEEEDSFVERAEFTEDHFPPKSVGGKNTLLACKPCNSGMGHQLDYSLKQYLHLQAFLRKKQGAAYDFRMTYNGIPGRYGISNYWMDQKLVQNIPFKQYPFIKQWITDKTLTERSFTMSFIAPSQELIQKALLRSAYLYCFQNWGYDFVYSKNAQRIRAVISGTEKHPLANFGVFGDVSMKDLPAGFYFIKSPKKLQAILVSLEIKILEPTYSQKVFVIIPGRDDRCWEQLGSFQSMIAKKKMHFVLIKLYPDCIQRGEYFGYSKAWDIYFTTSRD